MADAADKIVEYRLAWHPHAGGYYRIRLEGKPWRDWVQVAAADLSALAAIFQESPVYLTANGTISTGVEPVGI